MAIFISSMGSIDAPQINVCYCVCDDGVDGNTLGTLPTDIVGGNPTELGCLIPRPAESQGSPTGTDITTQRVASRYP